MDGSLFVSSEYVFDLILVVIKRVIDGHNRSSRIAKDKFRLLCYQRTNDDVSTSHLGFHDLKIYP